MLYEAYSHSVPKPHASLSPPSHCLPHLSKDWGAGSGKGTGKGQADTLACPGCRILLLWEASRLTLTPASFPLQNLPTWIHCPLVREMGRRAHEIQRNSDLLSICSTLYSGLGLFIYWSHGRESLPWPPPMNTVTLSSTHPTAVLHTLLCYCTYKCVLIFLLPS